MCANVCKSPTMLAPWGSSAVNGSLAFGLAVGLKVGGKQCLGNFPFKTFGCVGLWVLLCVLLVFGLCLGWLVWAHGFGMSDGLVCALGCGFQSCGIPNGGEFPL